MFTQTERCSNLGIFPPFPSLSADCCLLQDLEKHQVAAALSGSFLQLGLGLAVYCYTHKTMVLINLFRTPFLWSFPFAQGALLQPDVSETRGPRPSGRLRSGFAPIRRGAKCPRAHGRGRNRPFQQPSVPPIFTPVVSSEVNREPAAAQLHWLLTTNDLIPSINKA